MIIIHLIHLSDSKGQEHDTQSQTSDSEKLGPRKDKTTNTSGSGSSNSNIILQRTATMAMTTAAPTAAIQKF